MNSAFTQFLLCSLTILSGCAAVMPITAQTSAPEPPPPPRPVRRAPPRVLLESPTPPAPLSGLFESKEGGFKIGFPAMPMARTSEAQASFGKTTMSTYTLATSLAVYTVVHMDFPTALKDKFDLDIRFDAMRDGHIKRTGGRLVSENELYFGSNYGRDLVIDDALSTQWMRAIMVQQRLFVLGVETKGSYATQSPSLKAAAENRVKKFFDSFSVTSIPKPLMTVVELPKDFGVSVTGSTFKSTFLDISFDIPKDWIVLGSAETELLFEMGKEEISKTQPKLVQYLNADNSRILLTVSMSSLETSVNSALMLVIVEKAPYPNFLALSAVKTYATTFLDKTEKITKEPTVQNIGGLEFGWMETYDSAAKIYRRIYFSNRKGVSFELLFAYTDTAGLTLMLRSLESLKLK